MRTAHASSSTGKSERLPPTTPTTGGSATSQLTSALLSAIVRVVAPSAARRRAARARVERLLDDRAERGHVAHLAALEDLPLVVEVEVDGRIGQRRAEPGGLEARRAAPARCRAG